MTAKMTGKERLLAALRGKKPDRVPSVHMILQRMIASHLPTPVPGSLGGRIITDPLDTIVSLQERWGFDPVIWVFFWRETDIIGWPSRLFSWPAETQETWKISEEVLQRNPADETREVKRTIQTPEGELVSTYKADRYQNWGRDHPLEYEIEKLPLLKYRPAPEQLDTSGLQQLLDKVGDRALVVLDIAGPWDEAAGLCGQTRLCTDVYDRPNWVLELMAVLRDYAARVVRRVCETTTLECILINDTYVGMGMSPAHYQEYVLPFARQLVKAGKEKGVLVGYHNCGRSTALLELMADTGADSIETLTPRDAVGGDVDLADARKRIGDRTCLFGGFNERVLANGTPEDVRAEVKRCIEAAAAGGRYILRSCSQIQPGAKLENIQAIAQAVDEYGRY